MPPSNPSSQHSAYLLRIWRAEEDAEWRVYVENVHTGEKQGFRDMNALMAFLQQKPNEMVNAVDSTWREWKSQESKDGEIEGGE